MRGRLSVAVVCSWEAVVPLLPSPQLVSRAGIMMLAMMSDFVIACDVVRSVLLR